MYNEDPFIFRKVVLPDLAVLRFGVYDENDKLLGQRILPFNDLQMGYRHIALKTEANFPMALPMLFIQIDVKIYVPDGMGDFMDALSDPRAFASAQEKRAEQLKSLGIEESEIGTDVIASKGKKPGAGGKAGAGGKPSNGSGSYPTLGPRHAAKAQPPSRSSAQETALEKHVGRRHGPRPTCFSGRASRGGGKRPRGPWRQGHPRWRQRR
jgi:hypothetical protein